MTDPSYEVGYGRPPVRSRFQPGQSGNLKGRPKHRRSFLEDIAAALDASTDADGAVTKQRAFAETLVNGALARDPAAVKILAPIAVALSVNHANDDEPNAQEQALIEEFDRREQPAGAASHE